MDPNDLFNNPNIISGKTNSYLEDENYSERLANDVNVNGTYWPYVISEGNYVCEGCHRIRSIKENYGTIWPKGKKVCCIVQSYTLKKVRKYFNEHPDDEIPIDEDIKSQLETLKLDNPIYMWMCVDKLYWGYLKNKIISSKIVSDTPLGKFHLIKIDNQAAMLDCLIYMCIKLREDLFLYHNTNQMISPCPQINFENEFIKWKNNNFDNVNYIHKECKLLKTNEEYNEHIQHFNIIINNTQINSIIKYDIMDNHIIILSKLNSNLLNVLNFGEKNFIVINNLKIQINKINRSTTTHFNDIGFVQILDFTY